MSRLIQFVVVVFVVEVEVVAGMRPPVADIQVLAGHHTLEQGKPLVAAERWAERPVVDSGGHPSLTP